MKRESRSLSPPRKFFPNIHDPGYYREWLHFRSVNRTRRKKDDEQQIAVDSGASENSRITQEVEKLRTMLESFRLCWPTGYGGMPDFSASVDGRKLDEDKILLMIKDAVGAYGLDALRIDWLYEVSAGLTVLERYSEKIEEDPFPDPSQKSAYLGLEKIELLYEIGAVISSTLRYWLNRARGNNEQKIRSLAKKRVRAVFASLIPSGQGKGKFPVNPHIIQDFYLYELFRLYQILQALGSGPRALNLRIQAASKNFALSVDVIQKLWEFDPLGNPIRRSLTVRLKKIAFELTEERFSNIESTTIRKVLAS